MQIHEIALGLLGLILAALLSAFSEAGFRSGRRLRDRNGEGAEKIVSTL